MNILIKNCLILLFLAITEKVCAVLKERGIKKKQFAEMLGKSPSEVSKWLSGLHNLTLKSITKMEEVLFLKDFQTPICKV